MASCILSIVIQDDNELTEEKVESEMIIELGNDYEKVPFTILKAENLHDLNVAVEDAITLIFEKAQKQSE